MRRCSFQQRWLVVDVVTDADLAEWEGVHQVCDTQRAATDMRVGKNRYRWEFRLAAGETADDYRDMARLLLTVAPNADQLLTQDAEHRVTAWISIPRIQAAIAAAWEESTWSTRSAASMNDVDADERRLTIGLRGMAVASA